MVTVLCQRHEIHANEEPAAIGMLFLQPRTELQFGRAEKSASSDRVRIVASKYGSPLARGQTGSKRSNHLDVHCWEDLVFHSSVQRTSYKRLVLM